MRIALVSNFLPASGRGGAERYAGALATALAQRGHEVAFWTGDEGRLDGVDCGRLPAMAELGAGWGRPRKGLWHLREQWLPRVHRALRQRLDEFKPDVVHSHEPQLLSAAVFTAIAAADVPHVHTAHDFNLLCMRTTMSTSSGGPCGGRCLDCRLQRRVRRAAIRRRLDLLIAPSDFVRRRHLAYGVVDAPRALTIRHGAEPGRRRVRQPRAGALRLGFLGSLAPHKGVRTLLRVAEEMPAGWRLGIAGDGPLAAEVRAAADRDPRIDCRGEVDAAGRDAFLDGLDLIVIPSEWEEPATLVAVEAAVRGLPAVVSNRGGLPEGPRLGFVPSGDPAALLSLLSQLDSTPEVVASCSRTLLEEGEKYSWVTHVAAVEASLLEAARG
jgi:glycosyltransferase involved in cell wall biosynthesis